MNPSEYVKKYYDKLMLGDRLSKKLIFLDFCEEIVNECHDKHIINQKDQVRVIKKANKKWNKVAEMMEKKAGHPVMSVDGLIIYWQNKVPSIKDYI